MVQIVQREVGLRELALPQPRSEGIDGIVATGDIFREVEVRQQLGARHGGRRLGFLVPGVGDRSVRALAQRLIDSFSECQRPLGNGCRRPGTKQNREPKSTKVARNHWMECPSPKRSYEESHGTPNPLQDFDTLWEQTCWSSLSLGACTLGLWFDRRSNARKADSNRNRFNASSSPGFVRLSVCPASQRLLESSHY